MKLHFTQVASRGAEVLHAVDLTHAYPPHLHEHDSIGVVLRGEERIHRGGTTHVARAGQAFVVAAEDVHAGESIAAEYILLKIRGASAGPTRVIDDAFVAAALRDLLVDAAAGRAPGAEHRIVELVATPAVASDDDAKLREYVRAHRAGAVPLEELASIANVSRFHLVRRFRAVSGLPPHQYQTQMRVAAARRLLRAGAPIAEAALRTGFVDQSHLARHFKRIVGMTPGDYASRSNFVQDGARRPR